MSEIEPQPICVQFTMVRELCTEREKSVLESLGIGFVFERPTKWYADIESWQLCKTAAPYKVFTTLQEFFACIASIDEPVILSKALMVNDQIPQWTCEIYNDYRE